MFAVLLSGGRTVYCRGHATRKPDCTFSQPRNTVRAAGPGMIRLFATLRCLSIALLFAASAVAQAQNYNDFNEVAADAELTELVRTLDSEGIDAEFLNTARARAVSISIRAAACNRSATAERARLEARYEPIKNVDPEVAGSTIMEQRREILRLLDETITRQTACGSVKDNADSLVDRITSTQSAISQRYLSHRVESAIGMLGSLPDHLKTLRSHLQSAVNLELVAGLSPVGLLWLLVGAGLLAAVAGLYLAHRFNRWFAAGGGHDAEPQMKYLFPKPLAQYSPLLLEGFALSCVLLSGIRDASMDLAVVRVAMGILMFGVGCTIIDWATGPLSPSASVKGLLPDRVAPLRRRLRFFAFSIVASFVVLGTNWLSIRLLAPTVGGRATMIFLVAVSLLWLILYLGQIPGIQRRFRLLRYAGLLTVIVGLASLAFGYQNFAGYLIHGVTRTALALLVLWILLWVFFQLFEYLINEDTRTATSIRRRLAATKDSSRSGLGFLQLVADLVLWLSLVVYLIYVWDESGTTLDRLVELIQIGGTVGNIRLIPKDIIGGILVFAGLIVLIGWIKRWIDRRWLQHIVGERGAREAITTLIGYIGFVLAVLFGLVQAGVDLGGLAIVSGALALGIGFGMQEIANNFVSGIILLFERPVRAGDFVTIGNVEGFVRRIRLRATEIETLDNQNVLVPNSELVSGQVTNWVLRDPQGRLILRIGVSYGSDVQEVRQILERVANDHNDVITDGRAPAPRALFMAFGDWSLDFELRVRIQRIERRYSVLSDLNIAIDEEFRAAGITIPFPQRDLHIVSYPDTSRPAAAPSAVVNDETIRTRIMHHPEHVTRSHREDVMLDASIEEVWAAVTDIDMLKSWLVRDGQFRPFIGGPFSLTLRDESAMSGRIDIFLPPRRIRLVLEPGENEEPLASGPLTIDLLLKDHDEKSELTVIVSGIPASEDWQMEYRRSEDRWHEALVELTEHVSQK